jgi:hypothetical protein
MHSLYVRFLKHVGHETASFHIYVLDVLRMGVILQSFGSVAPCATLTSGLLTPGVGIP